MYKARGPVPCLAYTSFYRQSPIKKGLEESEFEFHF